MWYFLVLIIDTNCEKRVYIFREWGPFSFYSFGVYEEGINLTFFCDSKKDL